MSNFLYRLVTHESMSRRGKGKTGGLRQPARLSVKSSPVRVILSPAQLAAKAESEQAERARQERIRAALSGMAVSSESWHESN